MKSIIISGANSKERELSLSALSCILRKYVHPLLNVLRMTTRSKHKTISTGLRGTNGTGAYHRLDGDLLYLWLR